jgi:hypothetical protein
LLTKSHGVVVFPSFLLSWHILALAEVIQVKVGRQKTRTTTSSSSKGAAVGNRREFSRQVPVIEWPPVLVSVGIELIRMYSDAVADW